MSVRPQAAGTASGVIGFTQMAVGAALTQTVSILLAAATTATDGLDDADCSRGNRGSYFVLVRRLSAANEL